jgi:hypothetical protein
MGFVGGFIVMMVLDVARVGILVLWITIERKRKFTFKIAYEKSHFYSLILVSNLFAKPKI